MKRHLAIAFIFLTLFGCELGGEDILPQKINPPRISLNGPSLSKERSPLFLVENLQVGASFQLFSDSHCLNEASLEFVNQRGTEEMARATPLSEDQLYSFYVRQTDRLGNTSDCSSEGAEYILDTTPPAELTLSFGPSVFSPGNQTSPSLVLNGQRERNSTLTLHNGNDCQGGPLNFQQFETSLSLQVPLSEGLYQFRIKHTDEAQNSRCSSDPLTYQLDTTPPVLSGLPVSTTTAAPSASFSWSCSGSDTCTFRHTINQSSSHSFSQTDTYSSTATAQASHSTGTGTFYLHVQAKDTAGNTTSSSLSFVLQPPPSLSVSISPIASDGQVNLTEWTAGLAIQGTTAPSASLSVSIGNAATLSATADAQGSWSVNVPAMASYLTDGNSFSITATASKTGHTNGAASASISVDRSPPTLSGLPASTTTAVPSASFSWSCSGSDACTFRHTINQSSSHSFSQTDTYSSTATAQASHSTGTGTFYLHVQAKDTAGNTTSSSFPLSSNPLPLCPCPSPPLPAMAK